MLWPPLAYPLPKKGNGMSWTWVVSTVSQRSVGMLLQMVFSTSVQVSAASQPALSAGHLPSGPIKTHLQALWGTFTQLVLGILGRTLLYLGEERRTL